MSPWKLDALIGKIAGTRRSDERAAVDPEEMERELNTLIDQARDLNPTRPRPGYNP